VYRTWSSKGGVPRMSRNAHILQKMSAIEHTSRVAPGPSAVRAVGLDVGTTYLKAVCVDLDPRGDRPVEVLALHRTPTPGGAEAMIAASRDLVQRVVGDAGPVAAIGIASMAETGVPLDEHGDPLTPLLTWDALRPLSDTLADLDHRDLFARTGVRIGPKAPLATWAWLAEAHPDVRGRMRRWAGAADLVAHALTGRLATDHTLAGRTGAYLLHEGTWDHGLLDLVGLDHEALPEVADGAAGRTDDGVPVWVAGHDHQVGAHVCGVRAPGDTVNSLGTSEVVFRVLAGAADPEAVHAAGMSLVRVVGGTRLALIAGAGAAGAAYAAWVAERGLDPDRLALPPGPTGLLVLPYLRGRQCPDPDPDARLRAVGDIDSASPEVQLKALLEGLSLQTRWMHDVERTLDPGHGPDAGPMTLFGGPGARNAAWARVKAEVLPDGVRVVPQDEPVAVGAAVVAAERAGLVEPDAVVLPAGDPDVPDQDRYAAVYETFVREARRRERRT
jgi:xylulokinase